jgi:ubiquinone/menaquinone biosynthesis C-methylase UbiE
VTVTAIPILVVGLYDGSRPRRSTWAAFGLITVFGVSQRAAGHSSVVGTAASAPFGGGFVTGVGAFARPVVVGTVRGMPTDVAGIYDRLGAGYDRLSALLSSVGVNKLRADLLARARGEVVEVAVGSGVNLRHYPDDTRVTGLDLSGKALAAARVRAGRDVVGFAGLQADAARLPFGDGSVDTAVCTMAGCVFPDPVAVFREVRRIVRADGRLLLLEHVRPAGRVGVAAVRAIKPVTVRALGCHPDRPTVATVREAGFDTRVLATAARGLFVVVEATPR